MRQMDSEAMFVEWRGFWGNQAIQSWVVLTDSNRAEHVQAGRLLDTRKVQSEPEKSGREEGGSYRATQHQVGVGGGTIYEALRLAARYH